MRMALSRPPRPDPRPTNVGERSALLPDLSDERAVFRAVFLAMRRFAGPHPDFDDLVQNGMIAVFDAKHRFRGDCSPNTFVFSVCYRVFKKHERFRFRFGRRVCLTTTGELPDADDGDALVSEHLANAERWRTFYEVLDTLPLSKRVALVLYELEGLDTSEIAKIVDAPENTVRSRLRDGRALLAERLRAHVYFREDEEKQ